MIYLIKEPATGSTTALEFAYLVKNAEELGRDCDDAERILTVIYDTFYKLCAYRASGEDMADRFVKVYQQQLGKVYSALAASSVVCDTGNSAVETFKGIVDWINKAEAFKDIPGGASTDGFGKVRITENFNYKKDSDVLSYLNFIVNGGSKRKAKAEDAEEADATDAPEAESDANTETEEN